MTVLMLVRSGGINANFPAVLVSSSVFSTIDGAIFALPIVF